MLLGGLCGAKLNWGAKNGTAKRKFRVWTVGAGQQKTQRKMAVLGAKLGRVVGRNCNPETQNCNANGRCNANPSSTPNNPLSLNPVYLSCCASLLLPPCGGTSSHHIRFPLSKMPPHPGTPPACPRASSVSTHKTRRNFITRLRRPRRASPRALPCGKAALGLHPNAAAAIRARVRNLAPLLSLAAPVMVSAALTLVWYRHPPAAEEEFL